MYEIAVKAIILRGNKILILRKTLKEKQGDADNNCYDLPGGRVRANEQLSKALEREILEEAGLRLLKLKLHDATIIENKNGTKLIMLYYICQCSTNQVVLSEEHEGYDWRMIDEILVDRKIPEWIKLVIRNFE